MLERKKEVFFNGKKLVMRKIRPNEADKCVKLQSTLTEEEGKRLIRRKKEDYEKLIKDYLMIGLFDGDELVGQIAAELTDEKSNYISSHDKMINNLLQDSLVVEQGAYILNSKYRGHGLQGQLELELLERVKYLVENYKILKQKNKVLAKKAKQKRPLIMVSAACDNNPASALTSLKNGSVIINSTYGTVANEGDDPLTLYALMKVVSPKTKILATKKPIERTKIKQLLQERQEEVLKSNDSNPLPNSWVEKVTRQGYMISKNNGKYDLEKPVGVLHVR